MVFSPFGAERERDSRRDGPSEGTGVQSDRVTRVQLSRSIGPNKLYCSSYVTCVYI